MLKGWIYRVLLVALYACSGLPLIAQDSLNVGDQLPLGIKPTPVDIYDTRWRHAGDTLRPFADTLPIDFHLYNPANQAEKPMLYLGNLGQAMRPIVFTPSVISGFNAGFNTFNNYWYTQENVRYYHTRTAFTNLGYTFGQKIENVISITHSQNITPRINLAVDYYRPVSEGQSKRQKSGTHNMVANGWFDTKGGRYSALAAFIYNQTKNEENGGWATDNVFGNDTYKGKKEVVPVRLEEAQNLWSQRDVRLQQHFWLSKQEDSLRVTDKGKSFVHTIEYDNRSFNYTDTENDSAYYYDYFIDSTATDDNTAYWLLTNTLAWQQQTGHLQYSIGLGYSGGKYQGVMNPLPIHDGYVFGDLSGHTGKGLRYAFTGKAHFTPDYIGDLRLNASAQVPFKNNWLLQAAFTTEAGSPSFRDTYYFSNHYTWANDFSRMAVVSAEAAVTWLPWNLTMSVESHTVRRMIYVDNTQQPVQQDGSTQVLLGNVRIAKEWKNVGWKGYAWLQYASGDAVEVPLFVTRQSIYYKGGFIKGMLKANLGIDIWYNSDFFADGYNPATAAFFRQDEEKLHYYPVLDVFFDIQIKRARLFFMAQHLDQGLFKPGGYYAAPDYGIPDRAFKMGVVWQFYN